MCDWNVTMRGRGVFKNSSIDIVLLLRRSTSVKTSALLIHERPGDDSLKYFIRLRNRYRSRGIPRGNVTAATKQKLLISAAATVEQFPLLVGDISFVRDHV